MVSKNQSKNPNSKPFQNPRPSIPSSTANPNRNSVHVGGIEVQFPYQPYGSQLAFMARVISTLDRAHREGHCHALLESPTGTGKSLSLLCSTLAWQQNYKNKCQVVNKEHLNPNPEAFIDPLNHGGGFVPEIEPSGTAIQEGSESVQPGSDGKNKKKTVPTIFYSSRTHSQISQVIREYKKTAYRVPMSVLASRKHYCTNPRVQGKENIDEECKTLLRDREAGCCEFKHANKVKAHPSLQKGGCHEVHDIEDLVKVGQAARGCSYYAARSMADDAHLVFCPYNYIINPVIRGAMEVDIKGAIVILDEAHNIEDIARDSGSMDLEEDTLHKLQTELDTLSLVDPMVYQPLCEMVQDLVTWIDQRKHALEKREFQHYVSCWTGDKAIKELQEANITQQCFPILVESAKRAIKAATDLESEVPHLSGMAVLTLEGLFSSLTYFFSGNGAHIYDYQLALRRYIKRDARMGLGYPTHTISLWCMNPAVVFKEIADLSLSVVLTSGTLSPMNSFSSELGVHFGTCLEAPHVIDVKSQVLAGIISTGPGNYPLNASYKTADGFAFQDALGQSLEEILRIVPGGSLVFFPSYKLMEKLCDRWRETGQWSRLNARKSLFVEPRGGTQDDFENVLKGYYKAVHRPAFGKKRRLKRAELVSSSTMNKEEVRDGAALLAVCRGKVSEGIDFSDNNARVVIIIGIPFPNVNDIQVGLKKKYNDTYKSSKNLLSGSDWYCQQAFRALNQAAGRCIRHISDYGAIILLDERYREERNRVYISKWLRSSIGQYSALDASLQDLRSFFRDVKEKFDNKKINVLENPCINDENFISMDEGKASVGKKFRKVNKTVHPKQKVTSSMEHDMTFSGVRSQGKVKGQERSRSGAVIDLNHIEYIDLVDGVEKGSSCHASSINGISEELDICIVKETPAVNCSITSSSRLSLSEDNCSSSTVVQASMDFSDQFSPQSVSLRDPVRVLSTAHSSTTISPEREAATNHSFTKDVEFSLNLSVNSHVEKRRVFVGSLVNGALHVQSNASDRSSTVSNAHMIMNRKIDFDGEKPNNSKDEELVLVGESQVAETDSVKSIEKFSCSTKRWTPGGWRTTRSKLRLPRRALLSVEDDD